jgi:hypothetical protein
MDGDDQMAMNRIMSFLGLSLAALFGGCGASPTSQDVVGTWVNPDGGELIIEANGQFTAHGLPQAVFWRRDYPGSLTGKGTWKLQKAEPYWEVRLSFRERSGQPESLGVSAIVSGSGSSTYLYQWIGEEGENRYKLERK